MSMLATVHSAAQARRELVDWFRSWDSVAVLPALAKSPAGAYRVQGLWSIKLPGRYGLIEHDAIVVRHTQSIMWPDAD